MTTRKTAAFDEFDRRKMRNTVELQTMDGTVHEVEVEKVPLPRHENPVYEANIKAFQALALDPAFSGIPCSARAGHMVSLTYKSDGISLTVPHVPIHLVRRVAAVIAGTAGRIKFELDA